jgi:predicted O-methyltransferase YrrM
MPGATEWAAGCNRNSGVRAYGGQLDAIVRQFPYENALEVGCAWAVSTMAILNAQDNGTLTSVDIDPNVRARDEVMANGFDSRWNFILADSEQMWRQNAREFDLIYIDGDHSPDRVRNDLFEAWRFLRPGGVLIIDDVLHRANLDPAAGSEGHLYGVAFAAWQLVFREKIEEVRATDRLLYIPKPSRQPQPRGREKWRRVARYVRAIPSGFPRRSAND